MSYGILVRGNNGQTIIDDSNPCMHIVEGGVYGVQGAVEIVVNYSAPINSPYEPYVYFCPNGPHQIYRFRHLGGAGAWSGFAFYQSSFQDTDPPVYGGKWKAAAVMLPRIGGWGMHVFDAQSRVMFDSNREIVRFVGGRRSGPHQIYRFRHLGGAGAWSGFAFYQSSFQDTDPPVYGGKWKAAAVMLPRIGGWGIAMLSRVSCSTVIARLYGLLEGAGVGVIRT